MSEPSSESSFGKFLGKVRRSVLLSDEEIQRHKELKSLCTHELQNRINTLSKRYSKEPELADEVITFQSSLIHAKTEYLKVKEREEIGDMKDEIAAFNSYLDSLYKESELKKIVDSFESKIKGNVVSITKKIKGDVRKAS